MPIDEYTYFESLVLAGRGVLPMRARAFVVLHTTGLCGTLAHTRAVPIIAACLRMSDTQKARQHAQGYDKGSMVVIAIGDGSHDGVCSESRELEERAGQSSIELRCVDKTSPRCRFSTTIFRGILLDVILSLVESHKLNLGHFQPEDGGSRRF